MLLAIDVGNTTVNAGIFKGDRLVFTEKFITKRPASVKYYTIAFKKILKNKKMDSVIISSVVPEVTTVLKRIFEKGTVLCETAKCKRELSPIIVGKDITVPIKNLYKNPRQVGQDRLVNAYAGYKKFGGGLIIVDFGTAVTFDVVSKKGEYLGGIIVPGIETSLNALSEKAALLPAIKWGQFPQKGTVLCGTSSLGLRTVPKRVWELPPLIGKDTISSMLSGILNGYGALCDGLIAKIKKEVGKDYKVILTGGHARLISKYCRFHKIQPNLTLEGLYRLGI